ncbi:hypothetical protein R3P38DRAFT_3338496 [Favolaschia claudopus]|uniref:Uncharacterized protein n=1 Tax=Favolaschia claudopus TaxID=2862362 RepID=A0AAV9YY21_9AGAR
MPGSPDMRVYEWQGEPTPVTTNRGVVGDEEVAKPAAKDIRATAVDIYTEPRWLRKRRARNGESVPRRGPHAAKTIGISMGGGQTHPQNTAHSARLHQLLTNLLALQSIQRIAGWTNSKSVGPYPSHYANPPPVLFMAFAKQLHSFYEKELRSVCEHDPRTTRNFPARLSVFSMVTINFGPATVTFRTLTTATSPGGDLGGHLVLWDLKLIIRFPPGSTILIPSAILRHSNTKIQANETRFSFTQFTPAGLFRWVYNKFRTDADVNKSETTTPAEHEQRKKDRARRWDEGVKMYTRWQGPVSTV